MKRFSIVIPTKQRHETLGATIKTVINQSFSDYEVIVSDNFGTKETKEVVDSFSSNKIRYYRSELPLAMVDNWEFALSQASGEYIIFLGDDDGLIEDALFCLNEIILKTSRRLIQWERVYYSWPNMEPAVFANRLHIKYKTTNRIVEKKRLINDVISGQTSYTHLPMLYNSAVHYSLVLEHKKITGRFFNSTVPDLYSGFALAHLAGKFLSLGNPMSINAGSVKSNGASFMFKRQSQEVNKDFKQLNEQGKILFDDKIPYVRSPFIAVFEPYLKFLNVINSDEYIFDKCRVFKLIITNLVIYDADESEMFCNAITDSAAKMGIDVSNYADDIKKMPFADIDNFVAPRPGFSDEELVLDGATFGLRDVYDVSLFVRKFYDFEIYYTQKSNFSFIDEDVPTMALSMRRRIVKAAKILLRGTL